MNLKNLMIYKLSADGRMYVERGKWFYTRQVPVEVQKLYANEGWSLIAYQEILLQDPLVYPLVEREFRRTNV